MIALKLETHIAAPVERCFLLSLSIDLHQESTAETGERAIAGLTSGLIGMGERVTWRGRHFGLWLTHKSEITRYERPRYFRDEMVRGAFESFTHDHWFEPLPDGGTLMRDQLDFAAPLGVLGWIAERAVLQSYLTRFLHTRKEIIRKVAEGGDWGRYLAEHE